MKVCHILTANPYQEIGGTPLAAMSIIKNCKQYGIVSEVKHGIGFEPFRSFIFPVSLMLRLLRNDYDLIHIHDHQGYWYTFLPKRFKKKIVYTSHGETTEYYNAIKPEGIISKIKAKIVIAIQKRLVEQSDVVVAVSEAVKSSIIKYYNVSPEKIIVIYNGVDTKQFKPEKNKTPKEKTALWVGTNSEAKGLEKAIEYAQNNKMKLLVAGVAGEDTEDVEFLGSVKYSKMPKIYNSANLLLYFSVNDGHALVPLEAMACGLDVIASKESNIEIVPQEKDGTYKISGSKAIKIIKNFDWKIQAKKYEEIYRTLVFSRWKT